MDKLAKYPAVQAAEIRRYLEDGWVIDREDPKKLTQDNTTK